MSTPGDNRATTGLARILQIAADMELGKYVNLSLVIMAVISGISAYTYISTTQNKITLLTQENIELKVQVGSDAKIYEQIKANMVAQAANLKEFYDGLIAAGVSYEKAKQMFDKIDLGKAASAADPTEAEKIINDQQDQMKQCLEAAAGKVVDTSKNEICP